jgi:hypothetical protein
MSTDPQNSKPKFKLSKKSSSKGGKKPSLKLGKKSPGKLSLKPKGLNPSPSDIPPAGITQPPMPAPALPASDPIPVNLPAPDIQPTEAESPSVPEPISELPPVPEVPSGVEEVPAPSEELPPPPIAEDGGQVFEAQPFSAEVPVPAPIAEPISELPPVPEVPSGVEGIPAPSEELPPPPVPDDGGSVFEPSPSGVDNSVPAPFAEPVSGLPPAPEDPAALDTLPAGEGLPPPPPLGMEAVLPDPEFSQGDAPSLPPLPEPNPEMPVMSETISELEDLSGDSQALPPPPPLGGTVEAEENSEGLPKASDVSPSLPPFGDVDNLQGTQEEEMSSGLPKSPLSTNSQTEEPQDNETKLPPVSEGLLPSVKDVTSEETGEQAQGGLPDLEPSHSNISANPEDLNDSSAKINDLKEAVSSLSKEVARLKSESREELDSLFKRVDELDDVPAALKSEDEKVEDLSKSLESLKSNLGQEMESFKNLIKSQIENKVIEASSSENTSSSLSQSGEVKWEKEQFVVVAQDENAGESSPLDVFITNSESDALDRVHFNMTNDRPIYFLYPNTLAADYNDKY